MSISIKAFYFLLLISAVPVHSGVLPAEAQDDVVKDAAGTLRRIGGRVSGFRTMKTDFVQEKELAMFREKLVITGHICIRKPDRIAWHVDRPLRYSVFITDRFIRQWDEDSGKTQEISLAGNPVFKNVLSQLTVWFSGDFSSVLEDNDVSLRRSNPYEFEFIPRKNNPGRKMIKSILITMREDEKYLQKISIHETGGDVTTILFTGTELDAPIDERCFEVVGHV